MSHTGIVTVEELQSYMNGAQLDVPDRASTELILQGVQHQLELYLNRPLEPVQVRELIRTDGTGRAFLKISPVHSIIAITDAAPYGWGSTLYPFIPPVFERDTEILQYVNTVPNLNDTYPVSPGGFFTEMPYTSYIVDYIGGYNGYSDAALKLSIMRVAARETTTQHDDRVSMERGTANVMKPSAPSGIGWYPEELEALARLRRIVVM